MNSVTHYKPDASTKHRLKNLFVVSAAIFFMNCGVDPAVEPGIYYEGKDPYILQLGDTSGTLPFKKVLLADARGRSETIDNYTDLFLESTDTSLVKVDELKVIGVKISQNTVILGKVESSFIATGEEVTRFSVNVVE